MTDSRDTALYRPNVGLALFNSEGRVFLGKRAGDEGPYKWQMPQGGVDPGEDTLSAAYREMEEEIGVKPAHLTLLEELSDWLYYDFPPEVRALGHVGRNFHGQRQKWFAFRFLGNDNDVRLDTHTPEFTDWRWAPLETAPGLVIPWKRTTYEEVARRFARYTTGA